MVDSKRVEKKLPLLITDQPWFSGELDRYEARMLKFKRVAPEKYAFHANKIVNDLVALRKDVDDFAVNSKKSGRRPLF